MKFTNKGGISTYISAWLATDDYDYQKDNNYISATGLLKPVRSAILSSRATQFEDAVMDLSDLIATRMGTAIHDSIERTWLGNIYLKNTLKEVGHLSDKVIDNIVVNPDKPIIDPIKYPVYIEKRTKKEIDGHIIGGKFDCVWFGKLRDIKSTSVWGYIFESSVDTHVMQGSIYRWLNPDIITKDIMSIEYIFTDWSSKSAKTDPSYPQHRCVSKDYVLHSLEDTEKYIKKRIALFKKNKDVPDEELPLCTPKELWQKDTVWAYYKNPSNLKRSTKNFKSEAEANARLLKDNGIGIIVKREGEVKRCHYCAGFPLCNQASQLIYEKKLIV